MPDITLCILAGGQSKRFGSSKLAVTLGGEPILVWQARRLGEGFPSKGLRVTERWLSIAPNQDPPPGAERYDRLIPDPVSHQGPLAAMAAVLALADESSLVAFVPADMPAIEGRHLANLASPLVSRPKMAAAMARWADGPSADRVEPLPSVWCAGPGARLIAEAQARGVRGPAGLSGEAGVVCVSLLARLDADAWCGINTPADLERVRRVLNC